jgi:hypothetical protein
MRRLLCWLVPICLVAGALAAYDFVGGILWQGRYEVTVTVQRSGTCATASAEAAALFRSWWEAAGHDPSRIEASWQPVTIRDGDSFTIEVRSGGALSGWGRTLSYVREEVLLVKVVYADGDRRVIVADLPNSQEHRALVLQVP